MSVSSDFNGFQKILEQTDRLERIKKLQGFVDNEQTNGHYN